MRHADCSSSNMRKDEQAVQDISSCLSWILKGKTEEMERDAMVSVLGLGVDDESGTPKFEDVLQHRVSCRE